MKGFLRLTYKKLWKRNNETLRCFCGFVSLLLRIMTRPSRGTRRRRETVYGEIYDPTTDHDPLPQPPVKTAEQLKRLYKRIENTAFLREIDEKRLVAALSHMRLKDVKAGDMIFNQGEPGDHFYIVESGSYEIFEKDEDRYEPGLGELIGKYDKQNPCIGEIALLYCEERPHSVRAKTDGQLWEIDRKLYTRVVVKMAYERRQRHMRFISKVPMLESIHPYERVRLCDALELKKFKQGEAIIKEGDKADGMYFIEEGEVHYVKKSEEGIREEVLEKADHFGEMALLSKRRRNFNCTAKTDCELIFLETEAFERLLGKCKTIVSRNAEHYKEICRREFGTETPDEKLIR